MSADAMSFWLVEPGRGELRSEPLAPLQPGWVEVKTRFTGISRGTEALVFRGEIPHSEYQRMRAPFQAGDFPAPVKYGYINVGVVTDIGAGDRDGDGDGDGNEYGSGSGERYADRNGDADVNGDEESRGVNSGQCAGLDAGAAEFR
jgi:hypothetical protein